MVPSRATAIPYPFLFPCVVDDRFRAPDRSQLLLFSLPLPSPSPSHSFSLSLSLRRWSICASALTLSPHRSRQSAPKRRPLALGHRRLPGELLRAVHVLLWLDSFFHRRLRISVCYRLMDRPLPPKIWASVLSSTYSWVCRRLNSPNREQLNEFRLLGNERRLL